MKAYIEANQQRFLDELLDLLRIPSISAKSENKQDMITCAEAVKQSIRASEDYRRAPSPCDDRREFQKTEFHGGCPWLK